MFLLKRERPGENTESMQTMPEYTAGQLARELTRELEDVEQRFNQVTDPDMIDSCIYERAALMARLRYLLRTEREEETLRPALIQRETEVNV